SDEMPPPSNLVYSENPVIYAVGVAILQNIPSSEGGQVESYRIDPALTSGLSLDSRTGIISGTPDEISALATYTVTASNIGGDTTVDLSITIADRPQEVLLVVRDLALIRGDRAIKNHLEAQGYIVGVTTNESALPSDALGKDLIIVSSTGSSSAISSTFRDVAVGVIVYEGYIYDDMGFTGPTGGVDYGFDNFQVQVEILEDTHPLAAGLSGIVTVVDNGEGFFTWGSPNSNAAQIARVVSDPSKISIFAYEQGAIMDDGFAAPHRRVGMFLGDYTASHFTAEGWQLFDAAVGWALSTPN
ncbi:MAG: putative Ig domain-containing protein, partial [Deltaproteobacteria bacterium]|nr:putative Ig domain-containing protein [Deltaproteobacteria bacterium]